MGENTALVHHARTNPAFRLDGHPEACLGMRREEFAVLLVRNDIIKELDFEASPDADRGSGDLVPSRLKRPPGAQAVDKKVRQPVLGL
jgi:hypothetical protein